MFLCLWWFSLSLKQMLVHLCRCFCLFPLSTTTNVLYVFDVAMARKQMLVLCVRFVHQTKLCYMCMCMAMAMDNNYVICVMCCLSPCQPIICDTWVIPTAIFPYGYKYLFYVFVRFEYIFEYVARCSIVSIVHSVHQLFGFCLSMLRFVAC